MAIKNPTLSKSFVSRHIAHREIRRVLTEGKGTENTTVGAGLGAAKNIKATTVSYGKGKRIVKRIKAPRKAMKKSPSKLRRRSVAAIKPEIKTATKEILKSTGINIIEGVYTSDTTDSTVSSISLSAKTTLGTREAIKGIHDSIKRGVKVYKYVNQNLVRRGKYAAAKGQGLNNNSIKKSATSMLKGNPVSSGARSRGKKGSTNYGLKQAATRKFKIVKATRISTYATKFNAISRVVNTVKLLLASPQTFLVIGGAAAIFLIFVAITASISNFASMPTNVLMAEEEVAKQYVDLIENYDKSQEEKIESYKKDSSYDDVVIEWMNEIGEVNTNWQELISIIAVENEQDLSFSAIEQKRIKTLYDKMNFLKTRTEVYYCSGCKTNSQGASYCPGHVRLYVQVYSLDMEDIIDNIGLEEWQKEWMRNLVVSDWASLYPGIGNIAQNELSSAEIQNIIANVPISSATRAEIRETALSLVGKVNYFWGGKSGAGWNKQWGKGVKVTAPGSSSTGTYQPYGLDCSGYTDWVYKSSGVGSILTGGGSSYQWSQSYQITKSNLKVGDLVFKSKPGSGGVNHVGIYVGKDSSGNYLYCHCAWSQGVVVNSYKGFKYYRRPFVNFEEE